MTERAAAQGRVREEAAAWFTRLSQLSITTQALRDFREWRRDAANAAAYAEVESAWAAAGRLSADADIRAATREALARRPARERIFKERRRLWLALGAITLGVGAVAILPMLLGQETSYGARIGEQKLVVLEDGTRVRLNTDSQIRVRLTKTERHVELARGEAFFEVAHDAARPFRVEAGAARVQALGTRFDVWRKTNEVRVALVQGRVEVRDGVNGAAAVLHPDQQITVTARGLTAPQAADPAQVEIWTTGRMMFHATPLNAAIAEVNRYSRHKISLDAPRLAQQPVSGVFDIGDTEGFAGAVSALLGVKVEHDDADVRLVGGSNPAS